MKNGLPTTLEELNTIDRQVQKHIYRQDDKHVFGYFLPKKSISFISVFYNDLNLSSEQNIQKTKEEYLCYRLCQTTNVDVPNYHFIEGPQPKDNKIVLSYLGEVRPFQYKSALWSTTDVIDLKNSLDSSLACMVALGNYDVRDRNVRILECKPKFFDFNIALNGSSYWHTDQDQSNQLSIKLLEKFIKPVSTDIDYGYTQFYKNMSNQDILQNFITTKSALDKAENNFKKNELEVSIYNNLQGRLSACINHIQAKL